jgi:hypothetical protein
VRISIVSTSITSVLVDAPGRPRIACSQPICGMRYRFYIALVEC